MQYKSRYMPPVKLLHVVRYVTKESYALSWWLKLRTLFKYHTYAVVYLLKPIYYVT